VLAALYWALAALSPNVIGIWQDDGIYVSTGKALAQGDGYRHIELPSRPFQTKYPILYPILLAAAWLVSPHYPANVWLLVAPTAIAAAGLVVLCAVYWRAVFRSPRWLVLLAAVFAAFSPVMLSFVRYAMSEFVYAALAVGALLCIDHRLPASTDRRARLRWAALAAVLAGLAVLTRSIGVTLAGALLLSMALRRQWREAAVAAAVLAVCLAPWWAWQAWASAQNGALQNSLLEAPGLSYELWVPEKLAQTLRVVNQNVWRLSFGLGFFHLALPRAFTGQALMEGGRQLVALHVVCDLATLLVLAGFVSSLRRGGWKTVHLYAAAYTLLLLAWPFEPFRFLVPWTPFILFFMFQGVRSAVATTATLAASRRHGYGPTPRRDRATSRHGKPRGAVRVFTSPRSHVPAPRWAALPVGIAAVIVAVPFAREDALIFSSDVQSYHMRENPPHLVELARLHEWIRAGTPSDAVIASNRSSGIFLATGRRGYFFWPDHDPYTYYYGPDRLWSQFYVLSNGVDEERAVYEEMKAKWVEAYRSAGVTHFVFYRHINESQALSRLIAGFPGCFDPVYVTPGGAYSVYRIRYPE
jgi:hypothetical protein